MNTIASEVSRSIKEHKWLQIEYRKDQSDATTYFWISIYDIDPKSKKLKVNLFNQEYSPDVKDGAVYFDRIQHAFVIEGTTYEVPTSLIEKIINNYEAFAFLEYAGINERILAYYQKCYHQDRDVALTNYQMVDGIDVEIINGTQYQLTDEQFHSFIVDIKDALKKKKSKYNQNIIKRAINIVSVYTKRGIYPIVYRDIILDVKKKTLRASETNSFNIKLESSEQQTVGFQLSRYFDGDILDFINNFEQDKLSYLSNITDNLGKDETLDENPYIFNFQQFIPINIDNEFKAIFEQFQNQSLCEPLKCFFGINEKERKRKPKSIIIGERPSNIDQLRTTFNAMTRNVMYVQGPPGTGKTTTIIQVLLSCMLNHSSSLIVSNNNEAIDNIYRKLSTFLWKDKLFSLPVLRLGSTTHINAAIEIVRKQIEVFDKNIQVNVMKKRMEECEGFLKKDCQQVGEALQIYEEQAELNEQLESLQTIVKNIQEAPHIDEASKSLTILGIKAQIDTLNNSLLEYRSIEDIVTQQHVNSSLLSEYLYLFSQLQFSKLFTKKYETLYGLFQIENAQDRIMEFRKFLSDDTKLKQVIELFPFIISTNISATKLGSPTPQFDLMIMDESSQCNNSQALLPMARCKRALFVGDQNQLQPIVVMSATKNSELMNSLDIPSAYNYKDNSILSTLLKIDTLSKFILLREHYRCDDKIINFANKKYYDSELLLRSNLHSVDALKLIDVKSNGSCEKNTAPAEVKALLKEVQAHLGEEIAVITPFRKQAELIEKELYINGYHNIKVGTIHTFQGDEKNRIILSSGISASTQQGSFNWLKNNQQLINVATTRAKENLTLICDVEQVSTLSGSSANDFLDLINYLKEDGNYEVAYHENEIFTSKVKKFKYYNTRSEADLLNTLLQIKSVYGQMAIRSKVKVTDVLYLQKEQERLFIYGGDSQFDFVIYDLARKPLVVIEVTGTDHFSKEKVVKREKAKEAICDSQEIKLIMIHNDYVRRYSYIKNTIMNAINV